MRRLTDQELAGPEMVAARLQGCCLPQAQAEISRPKAQRSEQRQQKGRAFRSEN
ncbi:hypothetical protein [Candidatus Electronema sp. JM]|uniref:hypothetical protein n=1 Tax=Candidatus Electronema sp. JM TaxID=3401571 RepID=UPI003AA90536